MNEDIQDTRRDILHLEKQAVLSYMRHNHNIALPPEYCRRKNVIDSLKYRQQGNELYKNSLHNKQVHEKIWRLYSQSITLAPNNSEELAIGYGNRSALLLHLKMYKESIIDCDRAIHLTSSTSLKIKLLSRKAECLDSLNEPIAKEIACEAMKLINRSRLNFTLASDLKSKLTKIIDHVRTIKPAKKSSSKKNYCDEYTNFPRQQEAPCASESVSIKYDIKWGRHIVAEKDIEPGEVISFEDNCFTFIQPEGMYLYCSYCTHYTWTSIPCEHCIYDVYCSEVCRAEAWTKYHQFECPLYPHLWDVDEPISVNQFGIRLISIAIHEAGGIEQMRKQIEDIEYCKDPRVKGFTNGVFQSNKIKSFYSLMSNDGKIQYDIKASLIEHCCTNAYYLATHTNFFGRKLNILACKMFLNEDILFTAALLLHTQYLSAYNSSMICENFAAIPHAKCVHPFSSLFNHSCDPNVEVFIAKNNKTVVYATQPIKKGSQLFTCYGAKFYKEPRKMRRLHLKEVYHFTCQCLACTEKWSHICLPSFEQLEEVTPALKKTIVHTFFKMQNLWKIMLKDLKTHKNLPYDPKLMKNVLYFLRTVAKKVTTHCCEYLYCLDLLDCLLQEIFGHYIFDISSECS